MTDDPAEASGEDPGWHLNWRVMILVLPQLQMLYLRRARGDPLLNLRSIYASYLVMLALISDPLRLLLPFRGGGSASGLWVLGIGALTLASFFIVPRLERPLPCDSDAAIAANFRTRMFLRIAFATSPALFGFTAAFITNSSWVYFACLAVSIPALLRAAPTRAALSREQDELTARGCDRSLVAALRSTPAGPK